MDLTFNFITVSLLKLTLTCLMRLLMLHNIGQWVQNVVKFFVFKLRAEELIHATISMMIVLLFLWVNIFNGYFPWEASPRSRILYRAAHRKDF